MSLKAEKSNKLIDGQFTKEGDVSDFSTYFIRGAYFGSATVLVAYVLLEFM